ncbi:type II secretion system F family protein [Rubripirellula sp.]|nr:type II secretion system F family protein [Rubripirellula sp.]
MQFHYVATNSSGKVIRGEIGAESRADALRLLVQKALVPTKVVDVHVAAKKKRIKSRDLSNCYTNLADLLEAGVPLVRALELLASRGQQSGLTPVLRDLKVRVANGESISRAFSHHQKVFSSFAVNILRAGEEGGFLEESLRSLSRFTERSEDLRSRITGAIAYPAFLVVMGALQLVAMLVFFVPRFEVIFERLEKRGELPMPTVILLGGSELIQEHALMVVLSIAFVVLVITSWLRTESGKTHRDQLQLRIWGIGEIVRQYATSRFCRVLGTMLQNGVPILPSLEVSRHVTGNRMMSQAIRDASDSIASGQSLATPLQRSGQFSEELVELVRVGESTNRLDKILQNTADTLERQANRTLDLYIRMLEPLLLLVMAVAILFLLLALLLPILQSAESLT